VGAARLSAGTTLLRKHGVSGVHKAKKEAESKRFQFHSGVILSGWLPDVN
jgi:hypothetical protein